MPVLQKFQFSETLQKKTIKLKVVQHQTGARIKADKRIQMLHGLKRTINPILDTSVIQKSIWKVNLFVTLKLLRHMYTTHKFSMNYYMTGKIEDNRYMRILPIIKRTI